MSADFIKMTVKKTIFRNTIRVPNSSDPRSVGPDLGPNCSQILSADETVTELNGLSIINLPSTEKSCFFFAVCIFADQAIPRTA